jgi:RNA polymerase sigma-70 factor (ECF subfamily)
VVKERRSYPSATEADLVRWAGEGDQRAFDALVSPHREMLQVVCYRITGDQGTAQDALQNALLAAWQHLGRFEGKAKFSTWLYRIAHNAALAVVRKRVPDPASDRVDDTPVVHGLDDTTVDTVHAVRWALEQIPPDFRAALVLREYANLTYEEIAEVEGIKVATVKTRIARARQAVAALLELD